MFCWNWRRSLRDRRRGFRRVFFRNRRRSGHRIRDPRRLRGPSRVRRSAAFWAFAERLPAAEAGLPKRYAAPCLPGVPSSYGLHATPFPHAIWFGRSPERRPYVPAGLPQQPAASALVQTFLNKERGLSFRHKKCLLSPAARYRRGCSFLPKIGLEQVSPNQYRVGLCPGY